MNTVIIGVISYRFGPYIAECLESLLNQTLPPKKIVVCDDFSPDDSWEIITAFKNKYPEVLDIYRSDSNIGAARMNNFIREKMPAGDYYVNMDGDDRWHPNKLEKELDAVIRYNADIGYSDVNIINKNGAIIGEWRKRDDVPDYGNLFVQVFGKRIYKNCGSVFRNELYSHKVFTNETRYVDENLSCYWDWDRKIRASRSYSAAYSGYKLVDYRQHPSGISKTFGGIKLFAAHLQVYEKHLPSLASYPLSQQIRVILSFETRVGNERIDYNIRDFPRYSLLAVHDRVEKLYLQLGNEERVQLLQEYAPEISHLLSGVMKEMVAASMSTSVFIEKSTFINDIKNLMGNVSPADAY